ncbi:MAG: 3TM-type holin [Sneathiellaceae bacterium]
MLPLAMLIPAALQIAEMAAPQLGRWIAGEGGEKVARQVVGVAQAVTGQDSPEAAQAALRADPVLVIEMQRHLKDVELALYKAETERLDIVNRTMQIEVASSDWYVRRWRPTMGYALTATWVLSVLMIVSTVLYSVIDEPGMAAVVIDAIAGLVSALSVMMGFALTVLGINAAKRSEDKKVLAGMQPVGIVEALASRIGRAAR